MNKQRLRVASGWTALWRNHAVSVRRNNPLLSIALRFYQRARQLIGLPAAPRRLSNRTGSIKSDKIAAAFWHPLFAGNHHRGARRAV